jgi:hypothetical protein
MRLFEHPDFAQAVRRPTHSYPRRSDTYRTVPRLALKVLMTPLERLLNPAACASPLLKLLPLAGRVPIESYRDPLGNATSSRSCIYPPLDTPIILGITSSHLTFWEIAAYGQK